MNPDEKNGVVLETGKRIVLGRDEQCDLVDDHCFVSRNHAALELLDDGRVKLSDLQSSNGTSYRTDGKVFERLDAGASALIEGDADICLGGIESRYYRLSGKTLKRGGGLEVRFDHVNIRSCNTGPLESGEKILLDDQGTTVIRRGSFAVIVGTSGGGKSLLMNAVSNTLGSGYRFEGISLDPEPKGNSREGSIRFVPQDDAVSPELTVDQVMQFAAELRLSNKSLEERSEIIDDVLRQVNLSHAKGVEISKLSGGQRKRVSVAVDLLDYPQLLILDEPTSGLDAETELLLLQLLKNISRREGITVVCITHSLTACELADNIIVIGKKPGSDASRIRFSGTRDEIVAAAEIQDIREIYPLITASPTGAGAKRMALKKSGKAGPLGQWDTIFRRSWSKLWGDKTAFRLTFAIPLVLGVLVGLSQRNHADSLSPYFFLVLSALWIGMSLTIRELIVERRIYVRDKKAGLKPSAYLCGKLAYAASVSAAQMFLLYIPACLALVIGNGTMTAFDGWKSSDLVGVFGWNPVSHLTAVVVLFCVLLGGNMLGLIGSIVAKTEQTAVLLQIFFLLPQILISRVACLASYSSDPMAWRKGPFALMAYLSESVESWLQRVMDTVSLFFVSRFGVSIMEITAIRKKFRSEDDSLSGDGFFFEDVSTEWIALLVLLAFHGVVLWFVFKYRERQWGLR